MKDRIILIVAALSVIAVCLFMPGGMCNKTKGIDDQLARALNDTLKATRDSLNRETASKLTLVSDAKTLNTLLQSKDGLLKNKDEEIKRLMKATSKTNDATYVKAITSDSIVSEPVSVDTVNHKYLYMDSDKWFNYFAFATPKRLELYYRVTNEYVLKHEKGKKGELTTIKNMNPHTMTEEIISYRTEYPKPKKFSIGPAVGYGMSSDFKPRVFIGVTAQYSLIRF